jgi:hypothetical protein
MAQLRKAGVHLERVGSFDIGQSWWVMGVPLLKEKPGAPRQYWYNPEFTWDFNHKAPLDTILPRRKRNPPMAAEPALVVLKQVAAERGLPAPTKLLGRGSEGIVFSTTDPTQVCRVGTRNRVKVLLDWQESNAVVKVFFMEKMEAIDTDDTSTTVWVSWQEKINDNVDTYFFRKYKNDKETGTKILRCLNDMYFEHKGGNLRFLKKFEETEHLAKAIEEGMPSNDLALFNNLGMTSDNRVVAYDL